MYITNFYSTIVVVAVVAVAVAPVDLRVAGLIHRRPLDRVPGLFIRKSSIRDRPSKKGLDLIHDPGHDLQTRDRVPLPRDPILPNH